MQINGLRTRISIGGSDVLRAPRVVIVSERHAPMDTAEIELPEIGAPGIATGAAVEIAFGYRDAAADTWRGTVASVARGEKNNQLLVRCRSLAWPLSATRVTQAWEDETPEAIVAWAVRQSGLAPAALDSPGITLPRFAASRATVWQVALQAAHSAQRGFGLDMRAWALWLDADGVHWGDHDAPGGVLAIPDGLVRHTPDASDSGRALALLKCLLLPGLRHSRRVAFNPGTGDIQVRALRVEHRIELRRARTFIHYGREYGRV